MRTLRTIIMGSMMILPGLLLGLIVWYIAGKPESEPWETVICNGIPMVSVVLGQDTRIDRMVRMVEAIIARLTHSDGKIKVMPSQQLH